MLKKIGIDELEVGMYVEKVDRSWLEVPFFKRTIKAPDQIDKLRGYHVKTLHIDTDKGSDLRRKTQPPASPIPMAEDPSGAAPSVREPLPERHQKIFNHDEIQICSAVQQQAIQCVKEMFQNIREGRPPDMEAAKEVVDAMLDNMAHHPDVLASLSKLKEFDVYTFSHSVNVAVFSMTLGEALHYNRGDLRQLGLGALFHDIGKIRVPKNILNRQGPLKPEDLPLIRKHPIDSMELLRDAPGITGEVLRVPLEHHERVSGNGYPQGLRGTSISEFGMISSIADVYDAMTSNRVYQAKMSPYEALSKIYAMAKQDFHPEFVERFISRIGIYPVGSVVTLNSGEVGVVTATRRDHLLYPEILVLMDRTGTSVEYTERIDLLHDRKNRTIQGVSSPEESGVHLAAMV